VQPRQRVRWEEPAEPIAGLDAPERKPVGAAPQPLLDAEAPRRARHASMPETSRPDGELVDRPRQPRRTRKTASDEDDANAAPSSTPHPTVRAIEPAVQARSEPAAARPGDARAKTATPSDDRPRTTVRAGGSDRARPIPARVSPRERESAVEPVIRIHIGRVDVRAVTPAVASASPPAARDSKRALMSLEDYVQKRDRGAS